ERILPMDFFNWQSGSLEASRVARWSLTSGYAWQIGQEIQWPGGARAVIQDAAHPPSLPSGALPECGADEYYSTAEQQCTPECPAGEEPDEAGACRACAAGTFKPSAGQRACQNCTAGRVAAASGSRLCSECGPGTFQGAEGQEECSQCPAGSFAAAAASTACLACAPGSRAAAAGAPSCEPCLVGYYQELPGRSECTRCPAGITSEWTLVEGRRQWVPVEGASGPSACGCAAGTRSDGGGGCVSCGTKETTGVICRGKDDVVIAEGFFAEDSSLSVYQCFGDSARCVGGPPGATCADGRTGITCSMCQRGMKRGKGGVCNPCTITTTIIFAAAIAGGLSGLLLMYLVIDSRGTAQQRGVWRTCCSCVRSSSVSH
ncbi:unnamed protein product, partial [Prorocentrum cordatum]